MVAFVCGLMRAVAIGTIAYNLHASALQIGILACSGAVGLLFGYLISRFRGVNHQSHKIYEYSQIGLMACTFAMFVYCLWCFFQNSWGQLLVWNILSFLIHFFISSEQSIRPIMCHKVWVSAKIKYQEIIRQDIFVLGIAKVVGFAFGGLFHTMPLISIVALSQILSCLALVLFLRFICTQFLLSSIPQNTKNTLEDSQINAAAPLASLYPNNLLPNQSNEIKKSYYITLSLHIYIALLITPISTQAPTYSRIFDIPFFWLLVASAMGNVVFNLSVAKKQILTLSSQYGFYVFMFTAGCALFLLPHYLFALLACFLVGFAYSALSTLSSSRLYEQVSHLPSSARLISNYYITGALSACVSYWVLGFLLDHFAFNTVFLLLISCAIIFSIVIFNKSKNCAYFKS